MCLFLACYSFVSTSIVCFFIFRLIVFLFYIIVLTCCFCSECFRISTCLFFLCYSIFCFVCCAAFSFFCTVSYICFCSCLSTYVFKCRFILVFSIAMSICLSLWAFYRFRCSFLFNCVLFYMFVFMLFSYGGVSYDDHVGDDDTNMIIFVSVVSWIMMNSREHCACDTVAEWLRRWTRNPLGSARRGSNPLGVVVHSRFLCVVQSFVCFFIC